MCFHGGLIGWGCSFAKEIDMGSDDRVIRKFRLMEREGWLGGVCAGIGYYFGIQTWIVRIVCFLIFVGTGVAIIPYILLWFFVPDVGTTPSDYEERCA